MHKTSSGFATRAKQAVFSMQAVPCEGIWGGMSGMPIADSVRKTAQAFLGWGGQHAAFLSLLGGGSSAVIYLTYKISHWSDEARELKVATDLKLETVAVRLEKEAELRAAMLDKEAQLRVKDSETMAAMLKKEAQLRVKESETMAAKLEKEAAARRADVAQAVQQTTERFLMFGYAQEYSKYQKKALGDEAPPQGD
jgi:hypothetical protein